MSKKDEKEVDYDAEHLEILKRGALNPVRLSPLSYSDAISLRMKLYRLRKKVIRNKHEAASLVEHITTKFYPLPSDPSKFELMVCPRNMEFKEVFKAAGITGLDDDPPPLD